MAHQLNEVPIFSRLILMIKNTSGGSISSNKRTEYDRLNSLIAFLSPLAVFENISPRWLSTSSETDNQTNQINRII